MSACAARIKDGLVHTRTALTSKTAGQLATRTVRMRSPRPSAVYMPAPRQARRCPSCQLPPFFETGRKLRMRPSIARMRIQAPRAAADLVRKRVHSRLPPRLAKSACGRTAILTRANLPSGHMTSNAWPFCHSERRTNVRSMSPGTLHRLQAPLNSSCRVHRTVMIAATRCGRGGAAKSCPPPLAGPRAPAVRLDRLASYSRRFASSLSVSYAAAAALK
mmetsp:Transcript_43964/g.108825  ORF Transcript_43964/g.108825 Transcript_43964/m.108825 type:complete len:219 (-) Transcript_43964:407-1063(-)